MKNEEYYRYLFDLQESGATNMFGAARYLQEEFIELDREKAKGILVEWMKNYDKIKKSLGL